MTENAEIMTIPSVTLSHHRVVALAYDGLCTFEFGVAVEIFGLPRPEMGERWYRLPWPPSTKASCGRPAGFG
jgi:AraC family transcriptional activator FtrA